MADGNDPNQVRAQFGEMRTFANGVQGLGADPMTHAANLKSVANQWRPSNFPQSNAMMTALGVSGDKLSEWAKGFDNTMKYDSHTITMAANQFEQLDGAAKTGFDGISDQFRQLDSTGGRQLAPGVNEATDLINRSGAMVPRSTANDLPSPLPNVPIEDRPAETSKWIPDTETWLGGDNSDSKWGYR